MNEEEKDHLTEICNIGIGKTAEALSEITGEEVQLSIPFLDFHSTDKEIHITGFKENLQVKSVFQTFEGDTFHAQAALVFPSSEGLELVRLMLKDTGLTEDLTAYEQEAITEIGNILLNMCMSHLSGFIGQEMQSSLPRFTSDSMEHLSSSFSLADKDNVMLLVHINFRLKKSSVSGIVIFVMDFVSMNTIKDQLKNGY